MAMRSSTYMETKRRRRPILLIGGDKGGVGKSFGARAVAAMLRKHGYQVVGYDCDQRNGHLSRYYGDSMPVSRAALRAFEGWSEMYREWERADDNVVILVDLPGNIGDMMAVETNRLKLIGEGLDRDMITVWVASEEEDSIWLLETALRAVDPTRTIFWMNGRFAADPSKFELWNGSQTRADSNVEGGTEAFLPVLPVFARTKIARARSPFDDLSGANLGLVERIDFDLWWAGVDQALQPLLEMLGGRP